MKTLTLPLIIAFVSFVFQARAQFNGDSWKAVQASKKTVMYAHYVEVPFFVQKKNGVVDGINIEILRDFVQYLKDKKGVTITLQFEDGSKDFKTMYESIKRGQGAVLGMGSIIATDERKKEIGMTKNYSNIYNVMVSHNEVPTLQKLEKIPEIFNGFTGYSMKGSLMEKSMQEIKSKFYPGLKLQTFFITGRGKRKIRDG